MAKPKQKPAARKRAAKRAPQKKAGFTAVQLQRSARDPFVGPSSAKQIERSLNEGTRKTLAAFRGDINWE